MPKYKRSEAENGTWSLSETAKYLHCDPMTLLTIIHQGLVKTVDVSIGKRVTVISAKQFDNRFVSLAKLAMNNGTSSRRLQSMCVKHNIPLDLFHRGHGKVGQPFANREYRSGSPNPRSKDRKAI
jgi:hypothetical protein